MAGPGWKGATGCSSAQAGAKGWGLGMPSSTAWMGIAFMGASRCVGPGTLAARMPRTFLKDLYGQAMPCPPPPGRQCISSTRQNNARL
ncbi:hypothetical protein PtoMrB4_08550 [Metapseudomonas otitidis]|uniref:Uncharacterized protein n=1 Tax=Metapseudomonas otitidis TaxID=319939 RepID=A0A679GEX3_9GAMM|nr:hypothetical protein PtoMrB4_08550 [Pseudomonas otitidis]